MSQPVQWLTFHHTRFAELKYAQISRQEWSFFATDTESRVGPIYRTKAELLADLTRYAKESWGVET